MKGYGIERLTDKSLNMNTIKNLFTGFLILFAGVSSISLLHGQQCTPAPILCNQNQCGFPNVNLTLSVDGNNEFCDGATIMLEIDQNESLDFDYLIYYWCDGTVDTINFQDQPGMHTYIVPDSVLCLNSVSNYTIWVVGVKNCGNQITCRSAATTLTVNNRPGANFCVPEEVCIESPVVFVNSSCNETSYFWNFGDGITSIESNPFHQYATPGNYTVSLTVTNGCGSDTETRTVRVVAPPEANFAQSASFGCGPTTIAFTDQANIWSNTVWSILPNDTTRWDFTDTLMDSSTNNIEVNFMQTGTYLVTQRACNACGQDIKTDTVHIYAPPVINLTAPDPSCDEVTLSSADLNFTQSGEITAFNWTFTNGSPPTATGPIFNNVTFTQPGAITLMITSPCGNQTQSVPVIVATTETITFNGNPSQLCANGAPDTLQAMPANGQWSVPGGIVDPTTLSVGFHTFTYSIGAANCPNSAELTLEIIPAVNADIAPVSPACESLVYAPQVSYTGAIGNYAWNFPGAAPSASAQANPTGIQYNMPGNYFATLSVVGTCGTATDTVEIVIQANVQLAITPPTGPLCSGSSPITLQANEPGGVWSGNGITDATAGIFDPGIVAPGMPHLITYSLGSGACNAMTSVSLLTVGSANLTFPADTFCIDSDPRQLIINPPGGAFSGTGVDATGIFDPGVAGTGPAPVAYAFTDANGCNVNGAATVFVEGLPLLNLPDTLALCLSSFTVNLPATSGYTAQPTGGTSTWSGPGVTTPQGSFNSTGLATGNYTLHVEYERNDCKVQDSLVVALTQAQPLLISPDTTVCISDQFLQLAANLPGGMWSGAGINSNGVIDLELAGGNQIHSYNYDFQLNTSCEQSASVAIEIIDLSSQVNAGPDIAFCAGPATFTLTGASPAPGTWVGHGLINDQTGALDISAFEPDSVYVFQYCIESQSVAGCSACDSRTFVIYSNPVAAFELDGTACIGETFSVQNNSSGANAYHWDFDDNTTSTLSNPLHEYAMAGNYTIELIATNTTTTCKDTTILPLFVTTPPVAAFTLADDEGCAPFPLVIQDNSSGFEVTLTWYVAGDTTIGAPPTGILLDSITQDSTLVIRLMATNLCGDRFAEAPVLVHPYPIVRFGAFPNEGCSPLTVELANPTVGNPDSFVWNFGNGQPTSTDSLPPFPTYTTPDDIVSTYTITLMAFNECGSDTLSKEIVVYPPDVQAFMEIDTLMGCQPFIVNLASFSTPGAIISWLIIDENGNQQGSNQPNPQIILDTPGWHTVILYATRCGTDADTAYIQVLPAPEVDFTHRPFICVGQPITFENTSLNISGSEWDFGDNNTATVFSPTHIYDTAGIYTVTLTGYSLLNNCPTTITSIIEVIGNPVASFEPSTTQGCGPLTINFTNTSSGAIHHFWDFGDNSSASFEANPSHIFLSPGNYIVRLTVYDADSCFTASSVANIFVHPDPVANFSIPSQNYCLGYSQLQPANLSVDAVAYEWLWQTAIFTEAAPVITPQQAGTFPLQLVVQNLFQCRDTLVQNVTILPSPIAAMAVSDTTGCEDLLVQFNSNAVATDTHFWNFGNADSDIGPSVSYLFTEAGDFTVTLIAGANNGCPNDTLTQLISVWMKPIADFAVEKPETCGVPAVASFTNLSAAFEASDWNFGNGNTSTVTNPVYIYTNPGMYPVQLIVTTVNFCKDTIDQVVDIFGQPDASFTATNTVACEDASITFSNQSTEALSYQWLIQPFNEPIDSTSPTLLFTEPGAYDVQLIAIYNEQCRDTLTLNDYIRIYQSPVAAFSYTANRLENIIGDVEFTNLSQLADRYFWDLGDGTTTTDENPAHEYDINRAIEVLLVAYNDNNGAFVCADSITHPVEPEWITTFFSPNALSPGYGPEEVQVFKPVGIGIAKYKIAVYSPWGEQVWFSELLEANRPVESWNGGKHNTGDILPQGAYSWRADITFVDGTSKVFTGSVTLLR